MPKMTAAQTETIASKILASEAKGDRWLGKLKGELVPYAQDMIELYSMGPGLNARDRKTFVKNFLSSKAVGNPILGAILSLLVPIFLKILEAWLAKEAA